LDVALNLPSVSFVTPTAASSKKKRRLGSAEAVEIVADGRADDVGGVAGNSLKVAATKVAVGFHVTDCGLDGGSGAAVRV
jgi:hypothetical protein